MVSINMLLTSISPSVQLRQLWREVVKRIGNDVAESAALADERSNRLITELAVVAAVTAGPFVTAFCAELGRRFGGTAADWADRVRSRRAMTGSAAAEIEVEAFGKVTILEITEPLTDDAEAGPARARY
jgi:hypothetical protein